VPRQQLLGANTLALSTVAVTKAHQRPSQRISLSCFAPGMSVVDTELRPMMRTPQIAATMHVSEWTAAKWCRSIIAMACGGLRSVAFGLSRLQVDAAEPSMVLRPVPRGRHWTS
jgi:hypothetical protein